MKEKKIHGLLSSDSNFEFFFFFLAFIIIQMLTGYKNIQQGIFLSFHRKIVVGKNKIGVQVCFHCSCLPSRISSFFFVFLHSLQIGMGIKINFLKAIDHYCAIIQYF